MMQQDFEIVPNGFIQKGTASYSADTDTGLLSADEDIFAGVFIFIKEIKKHEECKIDPSLLFSKNIKSGMKLSAGAVKLEVTSIKDNIADVAITVEDSEDNISASGTIKMSLVKPNWEITDINMTGKAVGQDIILQLKPV